MRKNLCLSLLAVMLIIGLATAQAIKVHTIGDSTMAQYDPNSTVTRGWGMYLQQFLNGITVNNRGKGGASTRSFYQGSQYWQSVKSQMSAGDYVLIQFAHNDEKNQGMDGDSLKAYYTRTGQTALAEKTDNRGTVPTGNYKQYLIKYVNETREAGCNPVLVSPICRKYFTGSTIRRNGRHDLGDNFSKLTANGVVTNQSIPETDHTMDYSYQMKLVADSMNVPFIDLTTATKELYEKYGDTQTNALFFDGNGSTHLNETGATVVARLCAQKMKEQGILADNVNLNTELAVLPDSIDFGTGYKGQTLTKQAIIKGFELSPESGDITITATKGIDVSADQNTWGSTATIHYDAGMVVSSFYVKADIVSDDADINGQVTVNQGSTTITIPVSGKVVKITPGEAQDGVTTSWPLDNGTESSMSGDMSVPGLASVASMTIGSDLKVAAPQNIDGMSFYRVQPTATAAADDDANAITYTIVPKKGLTFVPTKFTMKAARFGTDGGNMDIVAAVGDNKVTLAEDIKPNRNNAKSGGHYSDYSFDIANLLSTGDPVTVKVYIKGLASSKQYGFRDVVLTGNFSGKAVDVKSYKLNVSSETPEAGTITVSPEGSVFDEGTEITLSTTENFSYHFIGWEDPEGNYVSERNPFTFNIDHDMTVKAVYEKATVYNLNVNLTDGARKNLVKVEPEGHLDGNTHQYETGTQVKLTALNNKIMTFTGWDDNSTNAERTITMDADKNVTATFSPADYIVGWDLYDDDPKSERAADYKSDSENAGLLSLRDSIGNTTSWLSRGAGNGQENGKYAARIWRPLTDKLYFEVSFSTRGLHNIVVSNDLGNDYNSYTTYYEQASVDGKHYETVGTFTLPDRGWAGNQDIALPDSFSNRDKVYVRWMPDYSSPLIGATSDKDGLSIAEIYVLGESDIANDTIPPTLVSSNPENAATGVSANGSIVLTFDEKVKAGNGDATLDGETLQPIVSGKTVVYKYSGLKYATAYTFVLPSGAITDRNGNAFGGTSITFTTMERTQPAARLYDAVVAADGTGDYKTLQEAIAASPEGRTAPWLIFVKKGKYTGHVTIPSSKPYIHIIGQDKNLVTIADSRLSGGDKAYGISDGATLDIESDNNYIEGVDLQNSYGVEQNAGPQALALCSNGDKLIMNNIKLRSYQDTWYTGGGINHRAFITNSWIEGAVDFFYGQGDIMITNDTINIVRKNGGYIVAPNHPQGTKWGYVFLNNVITAPGVPSETSVWLGRPWHNAPKTVFINTKAEVTIPATGWYQTMGGIPALWAEYNTMDGDGNPVDLSHRRTDYYYTVKDGAGNTTDTIRGNSATAVLTAEEAAQYTVKNVCGGDDAWNPEMTCEPCDAPLPTVSGAVISWEAVPYAICYVVTKDDEIAGFTTDTQFTTTAKGTYSVQAANEYGGLSAKAKVSVADGIDNIAATDKAGTVVGIYTIDGKRITKTVPGINIIRYADGTVRKVVVR